MPNQAKYEKILDALQTLLEDRSIQTISVSEIAQTAGIGKGSIYYYFPSKNAILDALNPKKLRKAHTNCPQSYKPAGYFPLYTHGNDLPACRNSSSEFLKSEGTTASGAQEKAFLHQKYLNHLISELKPELAAIIRQGIERGEIHFDRSEALAEIVLIVLTVKFG